MNFLKLLYRNYIWCWVCRNIGGIHRFEKIIDGDTIKISLKSYRCDCRRSKLLNYPLITEASPDVKLYNTVEEICEV